MGTPFGPKYMLCRYPAFGKVQSRSGTVDSLALRSTAVASSLVGAKPSQHHKLKKKNCETTFLLVYLNTGTPI